MNHCNITVEKRKCVNPCLIKSNSLNKPCMSIELPNGKIITGKRSNKGQRYVKAF